MLLEDTIDVQTLLLKDFLRWLDIKYIYLFKETLNSYTNNYK